MAVKKLTKAEILTLLGDKVKLTDEQKKALADNYEIEVDGQPLTWEEAQVHYKNNIDKLKTETIKARFKKDKDIDSKEEDKPEPFDQDAFRKQVLAESRQTVKKESFIETLKTEDREDAIALINSKIASGKTIDEAISSTKNRFTNEEAVVEKTLNDFGMPVQEVDGKIVDPVEAELSKLADK